MNKNYKLKVSQLTLTSLCFNFGVSFREPYPTVLKTVSLLHLLDQHVIVVEAEGVSLR